MRTQETILDFMFHHRQGLSCRQIASRTGADRRTVKKYIAHPELIGRSRASGPRASVLDDYRDRIAAYLEEDGGYRASWVYDQLVKQGYAGCYELVKVAVRGIKKRKSDLAFVRFETEPGRQAQVDFGEFQVAQPDGTVKKYYLFALVLGYSRTMYAELLERCDLPSFLEAHIRAFEALGGVPAELLYDRMRNVFVREENGTPTFTQALVSMAVHYGFAPRVAPAYSPWVKGKVERPMDFVRESFWRGYAFGDLATANRDLAGWLADKSRRVHGTTRERVDERFKREKPHLLALPPQPCDVSERLYREVRKDCTIAVGGNRYVVPHALAGRKVVVRLRGVQLRIFADDRLVITYEVPDGKGHLVQDPRFYAALRADKELAARKFGDKGRMAKGRATISPSAPRYPVDVQRRSMDVYAALGGEVAYG